MDYGKRTFLVSLAILAGLLVSGCVPAFLVTDANDSGARVQMRVVLPGFFDSQLSDEGRYLLPLSAEIAVKIQMRDSTYSEERKAGLQDDGQGNLVGTVEFDQVRSGDYDLKANVFCSEGLFLHTAKSIITVYPDETTTVPLIMLPHPDLYGDSIEVSQLDAISDLHVIPANGVLVFAVEFPPGDYRIEIFDEYGIDRESDDLWIVGQRASGELVTEPELSITGESGRSERMYLLVYNSGYTQTGMRWRIASGDMSAVQRLDVSVDLPDDYSIDEATYIVVDEDGNMVSGGLNIDEAVGEARGFRELAPGRYSVRTVLAKHPVGDSAGFHTTSQASDVRLYAGGDGGNTIHFADFLIADTVPFHLQANLGPFTQALSDAGTNWISERAAVLLHSVDGKHRYFFLAEDGFPIVKTGEYLFRVIAENAGHPAWVDQDWKENAAVSAVAYGSVVVDGNQNPVSVTPEHTLRADFTQNYPLEDMFRIDHNSTSDVYSNDRLHLRNEDGYVRYAASRHELVADPQLVEMTFEFGEQFYNQYGDGENHPMMHVNFLLDYAAKNDTRLLMVIDNWGVNLHVMVDGDDLAGSDAHSPMNNLLEGDGPHTLTAIIQDGVFNLWYGSKEDVFAGVFPLLQYVLPHGLPERGGFSFECHNEYFVHSIEFVKDAFDSFPIPPDPPELVSVATMPGIRSGYNLAHYDDGLYFASVDQNSFTRYEILTGGQAEGYPKTWPADSGAVGIHGINFASGIGDEDTIIASALDSNPPGVAGFNMLLQPKYSYDSGTEPVNSLQVGENIYTIDRAVNNVYVYNPLDGNPEDPIDLGAANDPGGAGAGVRDLFADAAHLYAVGENIDGFIYMFPDGTSQQHVSLGGQEMTGIYVVSQNEIYLNTGHKIMLVDISGTLYRQWELSDHAHGYVGVQVVGGYLYTVTFHNFNAGPGAEDAVVLKYQL